MRREIPAVRILPMSATAEGFRGRSIKAVQAELFLRQLPARGGRYRYLRAGLNAGAGTIVLFQYQACVIASAIFFRDEKFAEPIDDSRGVLHFDANSFRTFDPMDAAAMRKAWPSFRAFGHVKQHLNPTRYPLFKKRLRNVVAPVHLTS